MQTVGRRGVLALIGSGLAGIAAKRVHAQPSSANLTLGLTPVFLTNDLELLSALKAYLEASAGRAVRLVLRRTYEEITTLLVTDQLDAAWICGYPYIAFRDRLDLLAAPVWQGRPLYQSYVIAGKSNAATSFEDLRASVHAFSDPNSNSGYLVTTARLAEKGLRPNQFFSRVFFTYGHRNVVRAVAAGLADSGSVDGYVWQVMTETEPDLTGATRIVRRSEWLGFPPIATPRGALARPEVQALQQAFIRMKDDRQGQVVLRLLRLDGFAQIEPVLFDGIAAKSDLLKRFG
ncbi:MAG: PhnD/SsuA/transferrin family substrate-binding protein [Rhodomicrobium sp.]|nr:PhnD/SsuA/transferrin family substrate-binding protein [Rhodomicrobium sp.]